ncbi:MAG: cytochrome P460 family protein [Rhodospirillales bacterium]
MVPSEQPHQPPGQSAAVIAGRSPALQVNAGSAVVLALALALASPAGARAESLAAADIAEPEEHFSIERAAELSKSDAQTAYNSLLDLMTRAYVASAEPAARRYLGWVRFNDAPYRSATHGNRYVNNYANPAAASAGYGKAGAPMPPGAVIAKDSFTATPNGRRYPGALFLMEKLRPEESPATADWRYVMIMPDGSTFGDSRTSPARMAFCHTCHAARADDDYLFFVPAESAALPAARRP